MLSLSFVTGRQACPNPHVPQSFFMNNHARQRQFHYIQFVTLSVAALEKCLLSFVVMVTLTLKEFIGFFSSSRGLVKRLGSFGCLIFPRQVARLLVETTLGLEKSGLAVLRTS